MSTFAKPENALKRAEELINVGQKQDALQALHDLITSKRYRAWQKPLERIMFKYVELCVDLRRGRFAKDGLIQYRIVCQQVNVTSLEEVIKHFMHLSTEKAEQARSQAQALEEALDVDDLEADKRPEDLMLSYVSGEKGKERSDRELVTPWFKFLWETYRTVLEILRNNSKLEALYAMTAHRAFQFCKQYKRTTEFRRLCEIIRNHLANLNKYRDQRDRPDLSAPESLQLYLDTRFEQLKVATELELWQEAFRSIEDIHGLMCMVKKTPKASLMVVYYAKLTEIFWISSSHLYHAYAWLKLFTLQKSFNKNLSQKDLQMIASSVVLAALAVAPYDHTQGASHLELENEKERNMRMANLIGFNLDLKPESREALSRSSLLSELVSKGVMSCATQEVKDLYHLLEHEFLPLDLTAKVQPLLSKISKLGGKLTSASSVPEVHLSQYVPALEKLATLRLLQQVSQVYQTMKIESLSQMIPFFDFSAVEKISVDAVKYNFIAMKLDHMKHVVLFDTQDLESDGMRDHLTVFAESLNKARAMIYPPTKKSSKLGEILPGLGEIVDKEHKRLLARKSIIEKRKEEQERQLLEMEREEESRRLKQQKITEEAEQKRLAAEYEQRNKQRILREIEERELEEAQALLEEHEKRSKRKGGKKPILEGEKVTKQILMERALSEQLRERQEMEKKLQKLVKTMDYLERAKREEAAPLIEAAFQQRLVEEKALHEHEQQQEIELSRQRHDGDLREKNRLSRMLENKIIFEERVQSRRESEFNQRRAEREERINQIVQARKQEREALRKKIFFVRSEEERLNRLREEEEARKHEEAERRRKEEAEHKAKLDKIAEKQRQRERELEEKERIRREALLVDGPSRSSELPAGPEPGAAAAPAPGKYVPRFRRGGTEGSAQAPPETDRWGGGSGRPAPPDSDKWSSGTSSPSSSDYEDDLQPSNSISSLEASNKRLDYMIQFLDRKLSNNTTTNTSNNDSVSHTHKTLGLPEFIGKGGGAGIFRVPVRAAVHPYRPPSLEIRPHPLRESQIGRVLKTIVTTENQLWGGRENGAVQVWELKEMYGGSDEAAPCKESVALTSGSGVTCLIGDEGSRVVWSGHIDGRIRCWKMDPDPDSDSSRVKEVLSWVAHRGPVMSMIMTCYGDLWSGSEGGVIKIWPWEELEKAFSFTAEERHMAALLVERSFIDLRNQVTANGFSNVLNSDVKHLLSDNSTAKVWSAGFLSFALWDARTRELLKMFNIDGQIERLDMLSGQDLAFEDEIKMKIVSGSKKEKMQTSSGFFQRSRNAIMGAADAVRRVASKGGLGDDNRRTEALIITRDGMIWTGCANGSLVQWDGNGNRLQDFQYHSVAVQCLCTFGLRIWVGYASGTVQVLDLEGNLLGGWVAHSSPVVKLAVGAGYVFTLANHGGIRGWNVMSPGPVDNMLRSELAGKEFLYTRIENLKILTGTWNVAQGKASQDSLVSWLGSAAGDAGIVVVGLQEVEMGAGVLAMSAAKETVGLEGSSVGQWWLDMIGKTLDEGSTFERVGSRQLAGLLIAMWVRNSLKAHVGDVDAAAVPCGFGRAIGNKGAVGLRIRVYDRVMCFVNCHFAAHLEAVNRRNADFDHVYRTMTFGRPSNFFGAAAAGTSSAAQMLRGANVMGANYSSEGIPELSEADMVIFLGDFNYRLDGISYDEARDFVSQRSFDWLREKDQLRTEMGAGNVFQGMREAVIRFPPTYKFEKHQPGLAGYDSGEKKRIPAWCDRVLYRDSRSAHVSECSLDCPVVSLISQYDACMDVTDSDHKPVRCIFSIDIAKVDESVRRQEFGDIMKSNEEIRYIIDELCKIPETIVSTNNIILQNQDTTILRITNKCGENYALFEIICEGQSIIDEDGQASDHHPRGSYGFPQWLEVTPAAGIIKPDHIAEVSIHLEDFPTVKVFVDGAPQNSWCEDTRDKEAMLVVKVQASYNTNETKTHRIRVRHCCSSQTAQLGTRPNGSGQIQGNLLRRADYQHLSSSYDMVNHLRNLHSP